MKDGVKIYTTDFIVEELEFVETKSDTSDNNVASASTETSAPTPAPTEAISELAADLPWS